MANKELNEYVQKELARGVTTAQLREVLIKADWSVNDVDEVLKISSNVVTPSTSETVPPPFASKEENSSQTKSPAKSGTKLFLLIASTAIVLGLMSGTAYAYVAKIGPFSTPPYNQQNILSGVLHYLSSINSASYTFDGALSVGERDQDALPFSYTSAMNVADDTYSRDVRRTADMQSILEQLQFHGAPYPISLEDAEALSEGLASTVDPLSGNPYRYEQIAGGDDFALIAVFETQEVLKYLEDNFSVETILKGQSATFNKDTPLYLAVPSKPRNKFLEALTNDFSALSPEFSASFAIKGSLESIKKEKHSWALNLNAIGDLGDLAYKVNADAIYKDDIYYIRINNLPGLLGSLSTYKGKWLKIYQDTATKSTEYSGFLPIVSKLSLANDWYQNSGDSIWPLLIEVAQIAGEENLIFLTDLPKKERIDGELLYVYKISLRKEALVSVYERVTSSSLDGSEQVLGFLGIGKEFATTIKSESFSELFDYYQKNSTLMLWVDERGVPVMAQHNMRIVPPDSAHIFSGKQINLTFRILLSDLNKPIMIEAPTDAESLNEIVGLPTMVDVEGSQ